MSESTYEPPKIWQWKTESGGQFASINRPIAGATHQAELPVGKHPLQLYSLATPNGVKVTILLEELLALGIKDAEYDAHLIEIMEGDQFGSGFVEVNPNSKIPALVDTCPSVSSESNGIKSSKNKLPIFESGAILLYLAEKFNALIPKEPLLKSQCLAWLFWQVGSGPYLGGGFGHFYAYAPEKFEYPIERFTMEVKRQLDVLDRHLASNKYMCGDQYTIADIAIWPWYGALMQNKVYEAAEFLQTHEYKHLTRWTEEIAQRAAVKRGVMVNRTWGELDRQLHERHDASDFELKTQDKITTT
jgi:GSH-dependent disulfide-bond oxidoreductase